MKFIIDLDKREFWHKELREPLKINGTFCISHDQIKNAKEIRYNVTAQFF